MRQQIAVVARRLNGAGIECNQRVAIALPNGPELAVALLAVASVATAAPLNPALCRQEFDFYLRDLDAVALITVGESIASEAARARGIPVLQLVPELGEAAGRFTLPTCPRSETGLRDACPDDIALVLHTSGTTSGPKMVPLSHRNLRASSGRIHSLELTSRDRCLNIMPLFHIHGLVACLLAPLAAGGSVFCSRGFDAHAFFSMLETAGATWYSAAPTMHQAILSRAKRNRNVIASRPLRFLRSCSATLGTPVWEELESIFRAPVINCYGMTEAAHQIAANPLPPRDRRKGTVGIATGVEVAIMGEYGLLARGLTGEVVIRGDAVTSGYINNNEANAAAFTDGWFRTGDQGLLDEAGYLRLTGRLKEIINSGGEKFSPLEIDEVLLEHKAVSQAMAFAIHHELLGEQVGAAIVLRSGMTADADEIRRFVASKLAKFKVPRKIVYVPVIPVGPTGKPQRIGLAKTLGLE